MAGIGVLDVIGLLSGVLGIIQFGEDNFPKQDSAGSTVRVTVGLDTSGGLSNSGGALPDVRLWNEAGGFLGIVADPGKVESGGYGDVTVEHNDDSTQQSTYTLFSANDDAICVAYASITWPDGDQYGWVGDWGRQCGGTWYYSNVLVEACDYKPDCLWIDTDGDQPQTGFQVHWPEFVGQDNGSTPTNRSVDYFCDAGPPFVMHVQPDTDPTSVNFWLPDGQSKRRRHVGQPGYDGSRSTAAATAVAYGAPKGPVSSSRFRAESQYPRRGNGTTTTSPSFFGSSLVLGDSDKHSAEELCASATSSGPDFLNTASKTFCRMSDKTLWPLCDDDGSIVTGDCFS